MSSDAQYTSSGREVKKIGKKNLSGALAQLRAAREGGDKRTDQYQVEEAKKIFDVVDDEEYERLQNERQNDDFIVDDDGFGYRDHGGEIWEVGDDQEDGGKKKKKRKLDANEQEITNFMMPMSTINKKKGNTGSGLTIKQKPKVSEEQSKDIMNNLFNQLDNKEADELEEINSSAILAEMNKPIAFNKEEQLLNKYNVTLDHNQAKRVESLQSSIPNQVGQTHQNENPFSKKRRFEEISNSATTEKQQEIKRLSEQLPSHQTSYFDAKSHDESSNNDYQSAFDDSKMLDQPLEMIQNQTEKLISDAKPLGSNAQQDDWAKIKQQNLQQNQEVQKIDQAATLNQYDYPLPLNPDGSLSFFWIDAHEENNGQDIYIFGKIYQPEVKQFVSCALKINGMQREIYALPKIKGKARSALSKEEEDKQVMNIFHELDDIRKKRFQQITKWKCKPVSRKYAFEMPIQHGDHKFLKIKYDCNMPSLPQGLTGASFECLFGANQSMLELFILKRKIKGPCWFTIKNAQKVADFKKTWCRQEIFVNDPKHIEVTIDDLNRSETPPLSAVCFSFKTSRSQHNTNEIAMISCIIHNNISQDGPTPMEKFQSLTLLRKLDGRPMPHDFEYKLKSKKDIQYFSNERQMIEAFINRVTMVDPDLLVAHNLCGGMFELLLARIQFLKINHWSRIGRMKKSNIPNKKFDTGGGSYGGSHWIPRQVTCGRLLVDTFLTSKELIRETNYDLSHLAKVQLKATRTDFDEDLLPQFYISSERLFTLTDHTEKDAYLTLQLMFHLSVIPLTKQLTNIAGNLWFRSLQNARAERNEMLLLHEFKKKKFILPDKKQLTAKELKRGLFGGDEFEEPDQNAKKGGKRKKAQYLGGLVIEPKAGFYDNIILLLDFNSLYPSIIQEYNLCFTTVNRRPSKNFNGTDFKNEFKAEGEEDNEELEVELPDKNVNTKDAVLPNVLRDLVQKRKAVKEKMKNEKDQVKLQQLEIRQKAIKLTANSMYGCLGFQSSRFHAKAIAALITRTGRETLLKTKDIAENKLGFNVVYGDTDSIMINTGSNQLQQALEMGKKLKQEVNCLYKCLEIEIDGVFKSLLLLKKKKYAALKYEGWLTPDVKIVQEMKGLDMVRRDWCQLSKNVGNYVLGQILSGKSREEVVLNLNEYLSDIGEKMKSGRINLSEYIITKQLTRALSEYSEIKGQPHVAIASRLKSQGKSESELVNNFIPYVICKNPYDPEKKSPQLADKAFHPDEAIAFKGKNEIDIDWYTTQQILPPITRLIEHIDGIDVEFVAQCLGVDPKKYKYHSEKKNNEIGGADDIGPVQNPILHTETEKSLKNRSIAELKVKCPYCQHFYDFPGIYQEGKEISGLVCVKCNKQIPDQYVMNRVNLFLKQLIMLYYSGTYECQEPACNQKTRQLLINNKCITQSCKGKMIAEYSETQTNDTLRYLQGLFNVRKYLHENKQVKKPNEVPNWQSYATFQSKVDSLMDRSKYNKVDLGNIFSFMGKA